MAESCLNDSPHILTFSLENEGGGSSSVPCQRFKKTQKRPSGDRDMVNQSCYLYQMLT